jgi:hypothetical protein
MGERQARAALDFGKREGRPGMLTGRTVAGTPGLDDFLVGDEHQLDAVDVVAVGRILAPDLPADARPGAGELGVLSRIAAKSSTSFVPPEARVPDGFSYLNRSAE